MFDPKLEPGAILGSKDLSRIFQGQRQKGMRCSLTTNSLVLIMDHTKTHATSIYQDSWDSEGVLHYRGTGQRGDQDLEYEGNKWLLRAAERDTGVFLFEQRKKGQFTFVGRVELAGEPYRRREPDADSNPRWVWVFPLRLAETSTRAPSLADSCSEEDDNVTAKEPRLVVPDVGEQLRARHEEIQCLLLEMGGLLGLDVWVGANDRNRCVGGRALGDMPRMRESLPAQFERRVMRAIELIDVVWLRGNRIEAAFEIEHSTSVYSGLLRMSDLVALHPNIVIRLYVVAPDERRDAVLREIVRPSFERLEPPLRELCGFIAYSSLLAESSYVRKYRDQLKPGFLHEIAEYAKPPEDSLLTA